jgi:hypothetical protein
MDAMQKHNDVQWLRGIAAVEVAIWHSDPIWKLFGALHLSSMVDYPVRIEALFRHLPASAGRRGFVPNFVKSNRAEVGLIPQRRGPQLSPGWHNEVLPVRYRQMFWNAYRRGKQDVSSVRHEYPRHLRSRPFRRRKTK